MDNPLVQPDPGLFIWTILTFLILLGLLAKFAWNPLLRALEERQEMIRNSLDDAEKTKRELLRVQQESAEIIAEARAEAQTIVSKSRAEAETVREDLKRKAKEEADGLVKNAERQIQQETARAVQEIRREVVDLSLALASKLIKKNLSQADNDRLIQDSLKQIETARPS